MKKKFIKHLLMIISFVPGFILIMTPLTLNRLTEGIDFEEIKVILNYITNEDSFEIYVLNSITIVNQNTHFIVTLGFIWIVLFFFLFHQRNPKGGKQ